MQPIDVIVDLLKFVINDVISSKIAFKLRASFKVKKGDASWNIGRQDDQSDPGL